MGLCLCMPLVWPIVFRSWLYLETNLTLSPVSERMLLSSPSDVVDIKETSHFSFSSQSWRSSKIGVVWLSTIDEIPTLSTSRTKLLMSKASPVLVIAEASLFDNDVSRCNAVELSKLSRRLSRIASATCEQIISLVSWWVYPKQLKTTQWYLQSLFLLTRFRFVQLLSWLFPSKLEVYFFLASQADWRAIIGTELYTTERWP